MRGTKKGVYGGWFLGIRVGRTKTRLSQSDKVKKGPRLTVEGLRTSINRTKKKLSVRDFRGARWPKDRLGK